MILPTREAFTSSEAFRDAFLETLTPGIIPRSNFISWQTIENKTEAYKKFFEFFRNLPSTNKAELKDVLRDALLADDAPLILIKTAFELLGHTGKVFVSSDDFINFAAFAEREKSEEDMEYIADLLVSLGISNILHTVIEDYFLGVQVGLETHRRKNVGGKAFVDLVRTQLNKTIASLETKGNIWELKEEQQIFYSDGKTSKKVDFLLQKENKKIGIEVNFYTASGSKPTEIKRSYGQVNQELAKVDASLVWVTDGVGYLNMSNSLKEARDIHENIYNLKMLTTSFESDLSEV